MTLRLDEPNLFNTEALLGQVLQPLMAEDARVAFLCDAGHGPAIVSRLRVMLTRKRQALEQRGKRPKRFRLHATIHKETHASIRYDCIVMWKSVNDMHMMSQELEDILRG